MTKLFKRCWVCIDRRYIFNLRSVENDHSASQAELGRPIYVFNAETKLGAMSNRAEFWLNSLLISATKLNGFAFSVMQIIADVLSQYQRDSNLHRTRSLFLCCDLAYIHLPKDNVKSLLFLVVVIDSDVAAHLQLFQKRA